MTRSDVHLCSWNSPAPLAGNTGLYLSRSMSAKQACWLQNLWSNAGTCVHCTNTCLRYQSLWPATWSSVSLTHGQAYHKTSSTKQSFGQWRKRLCASMRQRDITLNICWTKTCSFQSQHTTQPAVFRAANSLPMKTRFHRSHLKANKVSKNEGTRKVKYA